MKTMIYTVLKLKKITSKFTTETLKIIWVDEFICLRAKAFSFNCGSDDRNKLNCFSKSQPKNKKVEKFLYCSFGGE